MVVHIVVIVPELLASHIVADANEHGLVLEFCLVIKLDVEREAVVSIIHMLVVNIMAICAAHFRYCSPIIKGEPRSYLLVESKVGHRNRPYEHRLVC